ncbi:MAG: VWA domain-containing protein [Saprospiraceae bacterium]
MPFRFENADYLYALLLLPIFILLFWLIQKARKNAFDKFGNSTLLSQLMPAYSKYKHTAKFVLLLFGLSFLIVGWANPQWGSKREKVKRKSVDIFIALDISQSMMAEDIRPNRMERARRFAQNLVEKLKGDRLGIILFAGNAYMQMPLTTDYAAAQLFLRSANPSQAPSQGTAISEAIDLAEQSFEEENKQHKAVIIISDGETHDQDALDRAKEAAENGLLIYSIGVGTPSGGFIPTVIGGRSDYKRDKTGNPVKTSLNEAMMNDLANAGSGAYFNLAGNEVEEVSVALRNSVDKLEKREFEARVFNEYESYFQYFLGLAILFLIAEFLLSYRENKWLAGKDLFGK